MPWKKMLTYVSGEIDDLLLRKIEYLRGNPHHPLQSCNPVKKQLTPNPLTASSPSLLITSKLIKLAQSRNQKGLATYSTSITGRRLTARCIEQRPHLPADEIRPQSAELRLPDQTCSQTPFNANRLPA